MCIRYVTKPANFALTKGFCFCVSYNLFVVVWNSPGRPELRTRIDDLSEAEEYVVFVSVCSGQMCSCNFSVCKNFLRGLSAVTNKRCKASLQWKEGKKEGTLARRSYQVTISFSELGVCVCGGVGGGGGEGMTFVATMTKLQ